MSNNLKSGDILIDDTPVDFSFVQKMSDKEYEDWIKSGCPTPTKEKN